MANDVTCLAFAAIGGNGGSGEQRKPSTTGTQHSKSQPFHSPDRLILNK